MFCTNCGAQIPDGSVFCVNCGQKLGDAPVPVMDQAEDDDKTVALMPGAGMPAVEQPIVAEPVAEQPVVAENVVEQSVQENVVAAQEEDDDKTVAMTGAPFVAPMPEQPTMQQPQMEQQVMGQFTQQPQMEQQVMGQFMEQPQMQQPMQEPPMMGQNFAPGSMMMQQQFVDPMTPQMNSFQAPPIMNQANVQPPVEKKKFAMPMPVLIICGVLALVAVAACVVALVFGKPKKLESDQQIEPKTYTVTGSTYEDYEVNMDGYKYYFDIPETESMAHAQELEQQANSFIIADSDIREVTEEDLENLGYDDFIYAYYEIIAREGIRIDCIDESLESYFQKKNWYDPYITLYEEEDEALYEEVLSYLNDVEIYNLEFINTYFEEHMDELIEAYYGDMYEEYEEEEE